MISSKNAEISKKLFDIFIKTLEKNKVNIPDSIEIVILITSLIFYGTLDLLDELENKKIPLKTKLMLLQTLENNLDNIEKFRIENNE